MSKPHTWPLGAGRAMLALALSAALLAGATASPAAAQTIKPWSPPADSLSRLAHSARLRFKLQTADTLGGDSVDGYTIVGDMGRKLLASMGRGRWGQAKVVEATLDSLGLDVEVATDTDPHGVVFMLVRNPLRPTADGVGYLYWMLGNQVHLQGASYPPSHNVTFRAWWTGRSDRPYEAVTLFHRRGPSDELLLRLYRLDGGAESWDLVQYEGNMLGLGSGTQGHFADLNRDGLPEVVAYRNAEPDSFLRIESGVPRLVEEYTYTERPEGFVLHDVRVVPGVTETVRMFASLLVSGDAERARRLLVQPASLDSMLAKGWGRHATPGAWTIEYGEQGQPWPEWLELKVRQDSGWKHWIFHFWIKDGRWVIRDWNPVRPPDPGIVVPIPPIAPEPSGKKRR